LYVHALCFVSCFVFLITHIQRSRKQTYQTSMYEWIHNILLFRAFSLYDKITWSTMNYCYHEKPAVETKWMGIKGWITSFLCRLTRRITFVGGSGFCSFVPISLSGVQLCHRRSKWLPTWFSCFSQWLQVQWTRIITTLFCFLIISLWLIFIEHFLSAAYFCHHGSKWLQTCCACFWQWLQVKFCFLSQLKRLFYMWILCWYIVITVKQKTILHF